MPECGPGSRRPRAAPEDAPTSSWRHAASRPSNTADPAAPERAVMDDFAADPCPDRATSCGCPTPPWTPAAAAPAAPVFWTKVDLVSALLPNFKLAVSSQSTLVKGFLICLSLT